MHQKHGICVREINACELCRVQADVFMIQSGVFISTLVLNKRSYPTCHCIVRVYKQETRTVAHTASQ